MGKASFHHLIGLVFVFVFTYSVLVTAQGNWEESQLQRCFKALLWEQQPSINDRLFRRDIDVNEINTRPVAEAFGLVLGYSEEQLQDPKLRGYLEQTLLPELAVFVGDIWVDQDGSASRLGFCDLELCPYWDLPGWQKVQKRERTLLLGIPKKLSFPNRHWLRQRWDSGVFLPKKSMERKKWDLLRPTGMAQRFVRSIIRVKALLLAKKLKDLKNQGLTVDLGASIASLINTHVRMDVVGQGRESADMELGTWSRTRLEELRRKWEANLRDPDLLNALAEAVPVATHAKKFTVDLGRPLIARGNYKSISVNVHPLSRYLQLVERDDEVTFTAKAWLVSSFYVDLVHVDVVQATEKSIETLAFDKALGR